MKFIVHMYYTQLVDKYNTHSEGQLSTDNQRFKTPSGFNVYSKTNTSLIMKIGCTTSYQTTWSSVVKHGPLMYV